MSFDKFLHSTSDGDSDKNEMLSNFSPEIVKTTFSEKKHISVPFEACEAGFTAVFQGKIADGILNMYAEITLPEIVCKKDFLVSWKRNCILLILKKILLKMNDVPIGELTKTDLNIYYNLLVMDSHYPLFKSIFSQSRKASKKCSAEKIVIPIPFGFTQRPSLFLQTFRCPSKTFELKIETELNLKYLLDVYKSDKTPIEFSYDYFEDLHSKKIEFDELRMDVISTLSQEDKNQLYSDRNTELIDIYETTEHSINGGELEVPIHGHKIKDNVFYHSFFWEVPSETLISTSLENSSGDFIFKNALPSYTNKFWPCDSFRRIPYENENLHSWTNCTYYCDVGAKPGKKFSDNAHFTFDFGSHSNGIVRITRVRQEVYVWKGDELLPRI